MKTYVAVSLALVMMLGASGCMVSKGKYMEAIDEAEAAKSENERTKAQKAALEQQVKTLKELNVKLEQETQLAHDEQQRIQHSRDKERGTLKGRSREMEKQVRALVEQNRSVRKKYQDVKRHNKTLKSLVARYQKELKERERPGGSVAKSGSKFGSKSFSPKPIAMPKAPTPPAAVKSLTAPKVAPVSTKTRGPAPLNLNTASTNDMVLFLGLSKEVADKIVSNRPYRIKGELVAKNVIPKATFDTIKNRVTVAR